MRKRGIKIEQSFMIQRKESNHRRATGGGCFDVKECSHIFLLFTMVKNFNYKALKELKLQH